MSYVTLPPNGSAISHGSLAGLGNDDHAQYGLLAGRAGGQTLIGGSAAGEDLILESTSNASKGDVQLASGSSLSFPAEYSTQHLIHAGELPDIGSDLGSIKIRATNETPNFGIEGASIELFGFSNSASGGDITLVLGANTIDANNSGRLVLKRFDATELFAISSSGDLSIAGTFSPNSLSVTTLNVGSSVVTTVSGFLNSSNPINTSEYTLFGVGSPGGANTSSLQTTYTGSAYLIQPVVTGTVTASGSGSLIITSAYDLSITAASGRNLNLGDGISKIGFFGAAAVVQPSAITSLTDSTGGTADNTLIDVTSAGLADPAKVNDNFADLSAKVNAILAAIRSEGLIAT